MNTTKKGDDFEKYALGIINDALDSGKLGIYANQCKVYQKRKYYSKDRESDITFDLAIEVWPPGSENYTLIYLIECKNYTHKVPIDDIEEFYAKIIQVAGVNAKGVFITNNEYQDGAFRYARSKGMMLIHVDFDETYEIILHRVQRDSQNYRPEDYRKLENWDEFLGNFFESVFDDHCKVIGLEQLSTEMIEDRSLKFLEALDEESAKYGMKLPVDKLIPYLEKNYNVKTDFYSFLGNDQYGNPILGYYDREKKTIFVDHSIYNTDRFLFTLCHEIGHLLLHQHLKINQKAYNKFKDSEYNFVLGRHELKNPKNWIEWQANQFSSSLILPKAALWARVYAFQKANGIRNAGRIYYDEQPVNRKDFYDLTMFLSSFFGASYTSIRYRLHQIGILTYAPGTTVHPQAQCIFGRHDYIDDPRRRLRED